METSEYLATVEALHEEARRRGLFFLTAADQELSGRTVTIADRRVVSFSSCSYLGLERHPRLIAGVHDAVDRFGTQFSSSRGSLSAPPYAKLETLLSELFGGHALVTSSTALGHQVALGVLASEKDAIVMDHQVHHSVHMAATLARAGGTQVEIVKHGELERAEDVVRRLAQKCRTVWFAIDGVFSMYGDMAPIGLLQRILAVAKNVRLYVDDAHGMSWAGENGKGSFLSRMPLTERMVLATSLNKAFSAAGGCLVFPTAAERDRVRMAGGPMVFSGPVQPPMLGAAIASAEVHLSPEITKLQRALTERTSLANKMLKGAGLPLLVENESPIFFIRTGLPRAAFKIAEKCLADGYYVNVSTYPSVPMKRAGIRLTLTAAHDLSEVAGVVARLAEHVPAVMREENVTMAELSEQFARALPKDVGAALATETVSRKTALLELAGVSATADNDGDRKRRDSGVDLTPAVDLVVEQRRTIHDVDKALWDACLGGVGACSWDAMALAERVFQNQPKPEHNWEFLYVIVKDLADKPVAVTLFTTSLAKDDFLMRDDQRGQSPLDRQKRAVASGARGGRSRRDRRVRARAGERPSVPRSARRRSGDGRLLAGLRAREGADARQPRPAHHLEGRSGTSGARLAAQAHAPPRDLRRVEALRHRDPRKLGRAALDERARDALRALPKRRVEEAPPQRLRAAEEPAPRAHRLPCLGDRDLEAARRARRSRRGHARRVVRRAQERRPLRALLLRPRLSLRLLEGRLSADAQRDRPARASARDVDGAPRHGRRPREGALRRDAAGECRLRRGPRSLQRPDSSRDRRGGRRRAGGPRGLSAREREMR